MVRWLSGPRYCLIIYNCILIVSFITLPILENLRYLFSIFLLLICVFLLMMQFFFVMHFLLAVPNLRPMKVVRFFYLIDKMYVLLIEFIVFILRGVLVVVGSIKKKFWFLVVACPLMVLAVAYELVLFVIYFTGGRYFGFDAEPLFKKFMHDLEEFHKVERQWQCCGLTGPEDYDSLVFHSSCCESGTECTAQSAHQAGCVAMKGLIITAGLAGFFLAVLDILGLILLIFIMRAVKNEDDDEDMED